MIGCVTPQRGPLAILSSLLLAGVLYIAIACGGPSTAGTGPTLPPADSLGEAIAVSNNEWLLWKDGPGKFLDRDFFDCFELNGVPRPLVTPAPDPSGHSRARAGCDEALAAIEQAVPDYLRLANSARLILVSDAASPYKAQYDALQKARADRAAWAQAAVEAWKRNDTDALQTQRRKVPELAQLEALAFGVNPASVTPVALPTLDFIPGVPTPTRTTGR